MDTAEHNGWPGPSKGTGPGEKKHDEADEASRALRPVSTALARITTPVRATVGAFFTTRTARADNRILQAHDDIKAELDDLSASAWKLVEPLDTATAPAQRAAGSAWKIAAGEVRTLAVANPKRSSMIWVTALAWTINPFQIIHAVTGMFTGDSTHWGFLHGPARWMKDMTAIHWETGQMGRLALYAVIGILPLIILDFGSRMPQRPRKILTWVSFGSVTVFICGGAYFDQLGYRNWDEIYLTALFASAYYFGRLSTQLEVGLRWAACRIPAAAVITGMLAYSPGAMN